MRPLLPRLAMSSSRDCRLVVPRNLAVTYRTSAHHSYPPLWPRRTYSRRRNRGNTKTRSLLSSTARASTPSRTQDPRTSYSSTSTSGTRQSPKMKNRCWPTSRVFPLGSRRPVPCPTTAAAPAAKYTRRVNFRKDQERREREERRKAIKRSDKKDGGGGGGGGSIARKYCLAGVLLCTLPLSNLTLAAMASSRRRHRTMASDAVVPLSPRRSTEDACEPDVDKRCKVPTACTSTLPQQAPCGCACRMCSECAIRSAAALAVRRRAATYQHGPGAPRGLRRRWHNRCGPLCPNADDRVGRARRAERLVASC